MTYIHPEGVVWVAPSATLAAVTREGCYAETVRIDGPLEPEEARALLLAPGGVRLLSPEAGSASATSSGPAVVFCNFCDITENYLLILQRVVR